MKDHSKLETSLYKKIFMNRLINGIISSASLVLMIIFFIVREVTSEVKDTDYPWGGIHEVEYDQGLTVAAMIFFMMFFISLVFLAASFIYGKVDTVCAGGSCITLYRGMGGVALYVDGEKTASSSYYLESRLRDGSSVTVSLSKNALFAHMTFSNGDTPRDF